MVGIPSNVKFDNRYTLATHRMVNGHYPFEGFTNTRIYYNNATDLWHMELIIDPAVNGTTESKGEYPFGMHTWDIVSHDFSGSIPLNIYGCIDSKEFSCNNGACIGIEERWGLLLCPELDCFNFQNL